MSFSRAKLQRFNEMKVCTPSKVKDIFKSVAPQKDKFVILKSPSVSSVQTAPCFRTPVLPVKKKSAISSSKTKKATLFKKENDEDALQEKIVECINKDQYIKDLMEQIEDMKFEISTLLEQKKQLNNEKEEFNKQLVNVKKEHQDATIQIKEKHEANVNDIKLKMSLILTELKQNKILLGFLKSEYNKNMIELKDNIKDITTVHADSLEVIKEKITTKDALINDLENQLETINNTYEKAKIDYDETINSLNVKHKEEVQNLEYEMLKTVSDLQSTLDQKSVAFDKKLLQHKEDSYKEMKQLQKQHTSETTKLKNEYEAKIKQIEEDCSEIKIFTEIQCTEKCKDIEENWRMKLMEQEQQAGAILKECQAISEYNIIQCEMEKKKMKQELSQKITELEYEQHTCNSCKILYDKCHILEVELHNIISKLNEDCRKLEHELHAYKNKLEYAVGEKKIYELTIKNTHNTIEALKNRLLESDRDVEQLKIELEQSELEKLAFESKSNQLLEELQLVLKLYEDLEIQQDKYLTQSKDHINDVQENLMRKVDAYKNITEESLDYYEDELQSKDEALNKLSLEKAKLDEYIEKLQDKLQQKENDLQEVMEQLHEQQTLTSNVQLSIGDAVLDINNLEQEYKTNLTQLETQIKQKDEEINHMKLTFKQQEIKAEHVQKLSKQITHLRDKSNSYYHYSEYYKNKASEYEEEIDDLSNINKKYIDQSGKYDALLQKYEQLEKKNAEYEKKLMQQDQIIRQMQFQDQLLEQIRVFKQKNSDLVDDKIKMEKKINSQNKKIEKLKKEVAALSHSPIKLKNKVEKENINSPNRLLNSPLVGSPLKERN